MARLAAISSAYEPLLQHEPLDLAASGERLGAIIP
jgi:hypothetical protein